MKIIYKPEGGSERIWDVDAQNPDWDITYATEKLTDWPWGEFAERLARGSSVALTALIYVLRKRDEPKLTFDKVKPTWGEIDFEGFEDDETAEPTDWTEQAKQEDDPDPEA